MAGTILIPERFTGPPGSGNGGYTCGLVAGLLGAGPAEVSLRLPPPLGRELSVARTAAGIAVRDGEALVAEGRAAELELEVPEAVGVQVALEASRAGWQSWTVLHPFRTCVVCGPDRAEGDGYRLVPGAVRTGRGCSPRRGRRTGRSPMARPSGPSASGPRSTAQPRPPWRASA